MAPVRLSLAMITRDHASTVARALDSAAPFCDEMIVIDVGSRDQSRQIAEEHGAVVHHLKWTEDYAAARNESFDKCTGDWIVWLGADDVVAPHVRPMFAAFKDVLADQLREVAVVVAPYHWLISGDGA